MFGVLHDVLDARLGPDVAAFVDAVFSFHDEDRLRELMKTVGFEDPEIRSLQVSLRLAAPADFFWQYMLGTPLALAVDGLDAEAREQLETDVVERWQPFVEHGGLKLEVGLLVARARNGGEDGHTQESTGS